MEKTDGRLVGILGTVIIHLIVGIIIMAVKISELHVKANLILDLELLGEFENRYRNINNNEELRLPESRITTVERALQGDAEFLNIARNLASTAEPVVSREDYLDRVKDELIRSGQLGVDNYIDQQRGGGRQSSNNDNFVPVSSTTTATASRNEVRETSTQEVSTVNYRGETRIYYDLGGRDHTYMPIPVYKCQGAGTITLRIEVNQRGNVEKATVVASESSTDQCLVETAINSAYVSRFIPDINAPKIQIGTLTFQFVAQ